jgi:hypothetical protein
MLDYAANAVAYWPATRIRAMFDEWYQARGQDPVQILSDFLGRNSETEGTSLSEESFWQGVEANLQAHRVRMIFVADAIWLLVTCYLLLFPQMPAHNRLSRHGRGALGAPAPVLRLAAPGGVCRLDDRGEWPRRLGQRSLRAATRGGVRLVEGGSIAGLQS